MLWLSIPEETIKANYERDATPDPSTYYVKGEEDKYTGTQWKEFARIEPRYTAPSYPLAHTTRRSRKKKLLLILLALEMMIDCSPNNRA